jgi:peptidoglycan hydrolase-like protein with peptidoglycan-binding domain
MTTLFSTPPFTRANQQLNRIETSRPEPRTTEGQGSEATRGRQAPRDTSSFDSVGSSRPSGASRQPVLLAEWVPVPQSNPTPRQVIDAAMEYWGLTPAERPGPGTILVKPRLDADGRPYMARDSSGQHYADVVRVPYSPEPTVTIHPVHPQAVHQLQEGLTQVFTGIRLGLYPDDQQLRGWLRPYVEAQVLSRADAERVVAYNQQQRQRHVTVQDQDQLRELGFFQNPESDGITGPETREAARAFQLANDLTPDGIIGPRTRAALAAPEAVSRQQVVDTQRRLAELGYVSGSPDGVWTDAHAQALRRFQAGNGLPAEGRLADARTQAALSSPQALPPPRDPSALSVPERVVGFFQGFGLEAWETVQGLGETARLLNDANPLLLPTGVLADLVLTPITGRSPAEVVADRTGRFLDAGRTLLDTGRDVLGLAWDLSTPAQLMNYGRMMQDMVRDLRALRQQGPLTPEAVMRVVSERTGQNPSIQAARTVLDAFTNYQDIVESGGDPVEIGRGAFRIFETLSSFAKPAARGVRANAPEGVLDAPPRPSQLDEAVEAPGARANVPERAPGVTPTPAQLDETLAALRQGGVSTLDDVLFRDVRANGLGTPGRYNLDGARTMRDVARRNTQLDVTAGYPATTHDITHSTLAGGGGRLNNSVYPDGIDGLLVAGDRFAMRDFMARYGGDVRNVDFEDYVQRHYLEPQLRGNPRRFQYALRTMDDNMRRLSAQAGGDPEALRRTVDQVVDSTRSMLETSQEYGFLNHRNYQFDNVPTPQSEAIRQATDAAWNDVRTGYLTQDRARVERGMAQLDELQRRELIANVIPREQAAELLRDHITYHELLAEQYVQRYGGTRADYYERLGDKFNPNNPILDLEVPGRAAFEARRSELFPE